MRTEYQPPADVLAQIHAFLEVNIDFFGKHKTRTRPEYVAKETGAKLYSSENKPFTMAATPAALCHSAEVIEPLLVVCLQACAKVHGAPFQAQDAAIQLGYAADLYNHLVRFAASMGGSIELMQRLELDGITKQLENFIKIGQARKFPPPPPLDVWNL